MPVSLLRALEGRQIMLMDPAQRLGNAGHVAEERGSADAEAEQVDENFVALVRRDLVGAQARAGDAADVVERVAMNGEDAALRGHAAAHHGGGKAGDRAIVIERAALLASRGR